MPSMVVERNGASDRLPALMDALIALASVRMKSPVQEVC